MGAATNFSSQLDNHILLSNESRSSPLYTQTAKFSFANSQKISSLATPTAHHKSDVPLVSEVFNLESFNQQQKRDGTLMHDAFRQKWRHHRRIKPPSECN